MLKNVVVTVNCPGGANGGLHIDVSRWSHKLKKNDNDAIEFEAKGDAMLYMDVTWMPGECPFDLADNRLTVYPKNTPGKGDGKTGLVKQGFPTPSDVRYWITVYFTDPNGRARYVDIDPDMVIEA